MKYGVGKVNKIYLKQKANIRNNLVGKTKIKSVKNKTTETPTTYNRDQNLFLEKKGTVRIIKIAGR